MNFIGHWHWPQTGRLACPGERARTRSESTSTAERAVVANNAPAARARGLVAHGRTVHSAAGEHSTGGRLRSLPFWYERHASGCQRQRQPWAGAVSWSRRPDQHATPRQDRVSSSWPLGNARAPLTTARCSCSPAEANRVSKSERTLQRRGRGGIFIGETESKDQAGRLLAFAAAAVRAGQERASERGVAAW